MAKNEERALVWYERAVEQGDPWGENSLAWLLANRAASTREDLDRALELARRARESEPESAAIADTLGWVLVKLGRPEEATAHLRFAVERALELDERRSAAGYRYRLAVALDELGQAAEAAAAASAALATAEEFDDRARAEALVERLRSSGG